MKQNVNLLYAKDIIDPTCLEEYSANLNVFHELLTEVNVNLFMLKQIHNCPLHIFLPLRMDSLFWEVSQRAISAFVILRMKSILSDNSKKEKKILTLRRFKNQLKQPTPRGWLKDKLKPEHQDLFNERIAKYDQIDKRLGETDTKITEIRNEMIAHIGLNRENMPSIHLQELVKHYEYLKEVFELLCFDDREYDFTIYSYYGDGEKTEIYDLLIHTAKTSNVMNEYALIGHVEFENKYRDEWRKTWNNDNTWEMFIDWVEKVEKYGA